MFKTIVSFDTIKTLNKTEHEDLFNTFSLIMNSRNVFVNDAVSVLLSLQCPAGGTIQQRCDTRLAILTSQDNLCANENVLKFIDDRTHATDLC